MSSLGGEIDEADGFDDQARLTASGDVEGPGEVGVGWLFMRAPERCADR